MLRRILTATTVTFALAACDGGGKIVKNLTTLLGAAGDHPCSVDLDYQRQINGEPDDARVVSAADNTLTEQHWYADSAMIVFYSYQEDNSWCEVWTESGVEW